MFNALTGKLQQVFSSLSQKKRLTEENVSDAVREVRMALLEADVHYGVTKTFVKRVKDKALGEQVIKSVAPGQQFIKVVHDELVSLMGTEEPSLKTDSKPSIMMLCGLQGAGKTTHCVKLAKYIKKKESGKKPLLVACDLQRPAAIEQLKTLGSKIDVPVFCLTDELDPVKVAKAALVYAKAEGYDCIIVDTAGRLHVDEELMEQLKELKTLLNPDEVLFVANATTGQDAVTSASEFHKHIGITGSILTMLDGNARAGAALSIREITGMPLKFEGIGEKLDDLQLFHPHSMADRVLGMGDTINLVKRAQEHMDEELSQKLENKIRKASFTYDDYLQQMQVVKKMGSFNSLLKMIPGLGNMGDLSGSEKEFAKMEAMILSMTVNERTEKDELSVPRRKRIAKGSGTQIEDVNKLVKSFKNVKQLFKRMPNKKQMEKMLGGFAWH
ncbi:MAG: signal recognition particle protein [Parachlamydiales bacterium]|nr:signal recognition particle protein [Parachlamydiales bacterium]